MGGKVLEYEAKTIRNEGRKEGREEGREEGIMLMAFRFASSKLKQGIQEDVIVDEMVSFLQMDKNIARITLEKAKSRISWNYNEYNVLRKMNGGGNLYLWNREW